MLAWSDDEQELWRREALQRLMMREVEREAANERAKEDE